MARAGVRGGQSSNYNYDGLSDGQGQLIIASCSPGGHSYESEHNGIFTGELLNLLRWGTDDFEEEEINVDNLARVLDIKVQQAAQKYGAQKPFTSIPEVGKSIILGINHHRPRRTFGDKICEFVRKRESGAPTDIMVITKLNSYLTGAYKTKGFDDFYQLFDAHYLVYFSQEHIDWQEVCQELIREHDRVLVSRRAESRSAVPRAGLIGYAKDIDVARQEAREGEGFTVTLSGEQRSTSIEQTKVGDFKEGVRTSISIQQSQKVASGITAHQPSSKQFSSKDRNYILEDVEAQIDDVVVTRPLRTALEFPVREDIFLEIVDSVLRNSKEAADEVRKRFRERWDSAKVIPPNITNLRIGAEVSE